MRNRTYNPFPYQPILSHFYEGTGMPAAVSGDALHVRSVWDFSNWMRDNFPDVFQLVTQSRPDLLDAGAVVASGALAPATAGAGLAGLAEMDNSAPVTDWGRQLLDIAKTYLQVDAQRDLLQANIRLAERGLPPINAGQVAPQVNVGLSADVQKLAVFGLAGLVVVGLMSAARKK